MKSKALAPLLLLFPFAALSQTPAYNPQQTFAPLTLPQPVNSYRAANGAPGPQYWQNRADYLLHATLDTQAKVLHGEETITYTNNSPETLTSLWVQLDQNTYRADARSNLAAGGRRGVVNANHTEGYELEDVQIYNPTKSPTQKGASQKAVYVVSDTRMQVRLAVPLTPGATTKLLIRYHFTIPGRWGGRMSWGDSKTGPIFDMAQWYPRMCVFDDLHGWDTEPYLANEFYLEYGTFDYTVTVPSNMVVAGSGDLVNPREVLTPDQLKRLAQARASDKTVTIRTAEEAAAATQATQATGTKSWHFQMQSTRDVAFSASAVFLWDAARMNLPASDVRGPKAPLAMSYYPLESAGDTAWGRSTEYLKDSVERFSARWFPYPYPNAINVAGPSSGMEYPGILFDGIDDKGKTLFFITAHEIGHSWFPMILGSNERRDAWIDEGFNTFIDTFESDDFNHGEYAPKRDGEYAPGGGHPADEIAVVMQDQAAPPILTRADAIQEKYRHPITYFKSAFGLTLLREQILGPARFDFAFRKFIADWAFKHPSPSDFFRAMESEGGEDLSFFWRGWYLNDWQLDLALTAGTTPNTVTLTNRGQLVLPATLEFKLGPTSTRIAIPAETWIQKTSVTIPLPPSSQSGTITLDPDHNLPLANRTQTTLTLTQGKLQD